MSNAAELEEVDSRIPITIVTGFLGSGKTTLLNKWVNSEDFKDTLVLINEFGDVGLDHELVQTVDDNVVLLESGCVCCTLQGELVKSLATNLINARDGKIPSFKRVLIETTGLADPAGVISTVNNDDFCINHYRYDGTVTLLDGQFIRQQLEKQYEAVKQIALADIIIITKTDLIDPEEMEAIAEVAAKINNSARVFPVVKGNISPKIIETIGPYKASSKQDVKQVKLWLDKGSSDSSVKLASSIRPANVSYEVGLAKPKIIAHTDIESFAIIKKEPINSLALLVAINNVQQQYGDSILRLKGIISLENQDKPVIIHGVQGQLYPITDMDEWPEGERVSKLVFIVRASVLEQIKHIFLQTLDNPDESTMDYFRQIIDAAGVDEDNPEEVEEIVLRQDENSK